MRLALFSILLFLLTGCTSVPPSTTPIPTPIPTSAIAPTPAPDEIFTKAIYHHLKIYDTIPTAGKQARVSLYRHQPTALFLNNQGLVLVLRSRRLHSVRKKR
jgi:hypothetical protein